jgi:hypothetical protein
MIAFPAGIHDYKVDAAALMALALDQAHPAMVPPVEVAKKRDPYETDEDSEEVTWRTA